LLPSRHVNHQNAYCRIICDSSRLRQGRGGLFLANAFGGVALFLATLGIYGVLAYLVAQRTREIGIRVALGSTRSNILGMILREGFQLIVAGLVLGIIGAASLQKVIAGEMI
jgi:ABC-type antimicrobial peptide transport system permease subunit